MDAGDTQFTDVEMTRDGSSWCVVERIVSWTKKPFEGSTRTIHYGRVLAACPTYEAAAAAEKLLRDFARVRK